MSGAASHRNCLSVRNDASHIATGAAAAAAAAAALLRGRQRAVKFGLKILPIRVQPRCYVILWLTVDWSRVSSS